jgi:hypothetical protein
MITLIRLIEISILKNVSPILGFQKRYSKRLRSPVSKNHKPILLVLAAITQILQFFTFSYSQMTNVRIVLDMNASKAKVEERLSDLDTGNKRNLAFLQSYAGVSGIASRTFDVTAFDSHSRPVGIKRFIEGEYAAESDMAGWRYQIDLEPIGDNTARAHISWVQGSEGILFLYDVLPRSLGNHGRSTEVTLTIPDGWKIFTSETQRGENSYSIIDPAKAVFVISKDDVMRNVGGENVQVSISGKWQFTDSQAIKAAQSVLSDYRRIFGAAVPPVKITMMHLRGNSPAGTWEADTRGRSVTIFSADTPFASQSVQMLHEQLRHELFHLWFPEGAGLTGDYDWFFEGFALYESLKLGIRQNRIGFQDMLDTIAAAYKLDSSQTGQRSLIAASGDRWSSASSTVYTRGMLVAFLSDIAMLQVSGGKRSVEDLIQEIYQDAISHRSADGNDVVLAAIRRRSELNHIAAAYITGNEPIEWAAALRTAGIDDNVQTAAHRLTAVPKPDRRQKALLDKLGYNNWRNLSDTSK